MTKTADTRLERGDCQSRCPIENYFQTVSDIGDQLREKGENCRGIELPFIKPGNNIRRNSAQFKGDRPARDDFEQLNEALQM